MLKIVVRSKKDRDAVLATLERFYQEWDVEVRTLQGVRSVEEMVSELRRIVDPDHFFIVLLGREDASKAKALELEMPLNVVVHVVPRARVRNTRIEQLAWEISVARAKLRLRISWVDGSFELHDRGEPLVDERGAELGYEPAHDLFVVLERGVELLKELSGIELPETILMLRMMGGTHLAYCGSKPCLKLSIPDEGLDIGVEKLFNDIRDVRLSTLVERNRSVLNLFERVSLRFLKQFENVDTVIVPLSGGKDSAVALYLALKTFPREKIVGVYVRTGVDFPTCDTYVEKLANRFGIELVVEDAGVRERLLQGAPLPTHSDRWCTALKIAAIDRAIRRVAKGRTLVVVGDRDAESRTRSARPAVRIEHGRIVVAPLKYWSTIHTQLYAKLVGLELNELYSYGFYRIGCYICPALRSWELRIMLRYPELLKNVDRTLFERFLKAKQAFREVHTPSNGY